MSTTEDLELPELTDLVIRLTNVLDQETAALDEGRLADIQSLQREKAQLAAAVRQAGAVLQRARQIIAESDDPWIEQDMVELCSAVSELKAAAGTNEQALRAAMKATERVIRTIVLAARDVKNQESYRYTRNGLRGPQPLGQGALASGLDEVL